MDSRLQRQLDALICGECTEDDFMQEISTLGDSTADTAWKIVALIDQRYRRGQMPPDLFRSIESKIVRRELEEPDYGTTVDLHPAAASSRLAAPRAAQPDLARTQAAPVEAGAVPAESGARSGVDAAMHTELPAAAAAPAPISAPAALISAAEGRVLAGRYTLERQLGSGGMGTVFKALDRNRIDLPEGARYVALKILHEQIDDRPEVLTDLRREFYCAQLLAHRSIVKVYEIDRDADVAFFTMELLEGELLSSVIKRLHPRPPARSQAWRIIREVGAGLAHAHSRNVVHGDLKPHNIMITTRGEVRILDFGASGASTRRRPDADILQRNCFPSITPAYTCCELLDGQQTDPRDDLYALACLSYELLSGEHPFQRRRSTEARDLGIQPRRPAGLTRRQWNTLQLGLAWNRESRSISVRDWLSRLGLQTDSIGRVYPPRDMKAEPSRSRKQIPVRLIALLAALIAALLIGVGFWAAFNRKPVDTVAGGRNQATPANQMPVPDAGPAQQQGAAQQPAIPQQSAGAVAAASAAPEPVSQPQARPQTIKRVPEAAASRIEKHDVLRMTWDIYRVRPGESFAEINVRRSGLDGNTSFVWWTEPSSANPGSDFVAQGPTTRFFVKGLRSTSLFIKIVPNASRKTIERFYVVIAKPSGGAILGPTTRALVLIPPTARGIPRRQ